MKLELTANQLKNLRDHFDAIETERRVREARTEQLLHRLIAQSHNTEQKLADVLAEIGILDSRISKAERRTKTEEKFAEQVKELAKEDVSAKVAHLKEALESHKADMSKTLESRLDSATSALNKKYNHSLSTLRAALKAALDLVKEA